MQSINSKRQLQTYERLTELSRGIGKILDLETLLYSMTELACDSIHCDVSNVLLYEPETDLLKYIAGPVGQRSILQNIRVPIGNTIEGLVYRTAKSTIVDHYQQDSLHSPQIEKDLGLKIKNLAVVPLLFRGDTIGIFESLNKVEDFDQDDLMILETLASQAAIAILSNSLFDEVQQAYRKVDELERMKSNFIAITSHELRTPIGLILGHASFLDEITEDKQTKQQLEVIIRNANRLKSIIEDISSVNDAQNGASHLMYRILSLNQVLYKALDQYMPMAHQKDISFLVKIPESDFLIDADEAKILLAINHLLSNAITFSDVGCHIMVSAEKISTYVQVSIADNGIGIPVNDLPHVFDRFFQVQSHLTRKHGGMGLGLSITKSMIELHKGQIWVESIEGKGSKFSFILPLAISNRSSGKTNAFVD